MHHLHVETKSLLLDDHLKLHASQLRQKSQLSTHPLHNLIPQKSDLRKKKATIYDNWSGKTITIANNNSNTSITKDIISQNMTTIHTMAVKEGLQSLDPNPILMQPAPEINPAEQSLP